VDEWLERLGIAHLRHRPARRLSAGEAQRVSLARAFAIQPDLLLLDEPFSALDAPSRAQLLEDFQALVATTPVTVVFVTHDLGEALMLGERVAVLLEGRLRQVGPPEEVFSTPADPQVAAFVGVETVIPGRVETARDGLLQVKCGELRLRARGHAASGQRVWFCLRPEEVTLVTCDDQPGHSAANCLQGKVQRTLPHGPMVKVVLDCGFPLVALVSHTAARRMGLSPGKKVTATFQASAVHLIPRTD
jgi:tungstate transport system ATP-binding protein